MNINKIKPKYCISTQKNPEQSETWKCQLTTIYTGWWLGHPSEKYDFVNWDDDRNPKFMGKFKIHGNQTTNQYKIPFFRSFSARKAWLLKINTDQHRSWPRLHRSHPGSSSPIAKPVIKYGSEKSIVHIKKKHGIFDFILFILKRNMAYLISYCSY